MVPKTVNKTDELDWENVSHTSKGDHEIEEDNFPNKSTTNHQSKTQSQFMRYSNQFVLEMNWSTRNLLIETLSEFVALLANEGVVDNSFKSKLNQKIDELNKVVFNLPKKSTSVTDQQQVSTDDQPLDEFILNLTLETKKKIILNLIENKDFVIDCNSMSNEIREYLANENRNLINVLLSLPVKNVKDKILSEESAKNDETIEIDAKTKNANPTEGTLLEDVQNRQYETDHRLCYLEKQAAELHGYIDELFIKTNKSEGKIISIKGIKNLFEKTTIIDSYHFTCHGITWYLTLTANKMFKDEKFLGLYLNVFESESEPKTKWTIKAKYELRLISPDWEVEDEVHAYDVKFSTKQKEWGSSKFIRFEKLVEDYVEGDELTVKVLFGSVDLICSID